MITIYTNKIAIGKFCDELGSKKPTPGGGSVAGVQGALGCGLIAMVADLTLNNKNYEQYHEINAQVFELATNNKNKFLELADSDIDAYSQMQSVFAMPRSTDKEKEIRGEKMQITLAKCSEPPINTMRLAAKSIDLIYQIIDKSSKMAKSDLGCAATLLSSTLQNAWLNVLANTNYMNEQNGSLKNGLETEGKKILEEYKQKAEQIYSACC